jgi:hypothetical protein
MFLYVKELFFPHLVNYYLIFNMRHFNYNYNFWVASNFDTLNLFKKLVLIFEVVRNDKDALEHGKIM